MATQETSKRIIPLPVAILALVGVATLMCCGISFLYAIDYASSQQGAEDQSRPVLPATYTPIGESNSKSESAPNVRDYGNGTVIFRVYNIRAPIQIDECGYKDDWCIEFWEQIVDTNYEYTFGGITESSDYKNMIKEGEFWELPIHADRGSWLYLSVYNGAAVACEITIFRNGKEVVIDAARSAGTYATCSGVAK